LSFCWKNFVSPYDAWSTSHCWRCRGTIKWTGSLSRLSRPCLDIKNLWNWIELVHYFHVSERWKPRLYARFA
jgi:hypothetical protein